MNIAHVISGIAILFSSAVECLAQCENGVCSIRSARRPLANREATDGEAGGGKVKAILGAPVRLVKRVLGR